MTSDLAAHLNRYRAQALILDANLLLVLAIRWSDPFLIERHKKTRGVYRAEDYQIVFDLIALFAPCLTTPHILTEVSNQLGQIPGSLGRDLYRCYARTVELLMEHHIRARGLVADDQLSTFGFTDLGIRELARSQKALVITADARLVTYLAGTGVDALQYEWIRRSVTGS